MSSETYESIPAGRNRIRKTFLLRISYVRSAIKNIWLLIRSEIMLVESFKKKLEELYSCCNYIKNNINDEDYIRNINGDYEDEVLTAGCKQILQHFFELLSLDPVSNEHLKEYVEFCTNNKLKEACSNGLRTIMARRQDVELYLTAANYELNTRDSVDWARYYYVLGFSEHSKNIELTYGEYSMEINEMNRKGEIDYEKCFEKYRAAIKRFIGNINVHMEILKLTLPLKSDDLNSRIVNDMVYLYGYGKTLWDKLNELQSQGYTYNLKTQRLYYSGNCMVLQKSDKLYEYAMKIFNAEKNCNEVMKIFREGTEVLEGNALPLWKLVLSYMKNTCPTMVEQLYLEGSRHKFKTIAIDLRSAYLIWRANQKGIDKARILYHSRLKKLLPRSKKLHMTMLRLELANGVKDVTVVRKILGILCRHYASDDIKIWVEAMRFEYIYGSLKFVKITHHAAMHLLELKYRKRMEREYKKLKMEFENPKTVIGDKDRRKKLMRFEYIHSVPTFADATHLLKPKDKNAVQQENAQNKIEFENTITIIDDDDDDEKQIEIKAKDNKAPVVNVGKG